MTAMGHEDQFRPPSLSGRYRLGEATFAGMGGKEEDAPTPAIRGATIEPLRSTLAARARGVSYGILQQTLSVQVQSPGR